MNQQLASDAARIALVAVNMAILNSRPTTLPGWALHSKPYLRAIADNNYGLEDPTMCVLYALNNLTGWRGDVARRVKKSLNEAIK